MFDMKTDTLMSYRMLKFSFLASFGLFVVACGADDQAAESGRQEEAKKEEHGHGDHGHSQASSDLVLKLDGDKKWQMDDHTRSMFKKMETSFAASDHSSVDGLHQAGVELQGQVNELIKGCTMNGPAHDQLHQFLTGYIPAVESLAGAKDLESGRAQAMKVKAALDGYGNYFE